MIGGIKVDNVNSKLKEISDKKLSEYSTILSKKYPICEKDELFKCRKLIDSSKDITKFTFPLKYACIEKDDNNVTIFQGVKEYCVDEFKCCLEVKNSDKKQFCFYKEPFSGSF